MVGKLQYQQINALLNKRLEDKKALVVVHRGACGGNIIENTNPSFEQALAMGADMFECDLSKSTDGELFAFHDGNEPRLLGKKENIKTMSSHEIDALEYLNSIGELSGAHVHRFKDVLKHFNNGELFNIDRAWSVLPETDAILRKYPHAMYQAIIKTHVQKEYLDFFQNCPVKYMYMPIAKTMDEVRLVLSYTDINVVGVEAIATSRESEMLDETNIKWMRDQGLYVWVNSITLSRLEEHILAGGLDDDKALKDGADASWGVLFDRGYNVVQTDWPYQLSVYRNERFN